MPRKIEVEAYEFKELDEKAKENAREWARDTHNECGFSVDDVSADFKNTLSEMGLSSLKAWWSLSSCQGDGVAFEGKVDLDSFIERQKQMREYAKPSKHPKSDQRYSSFVIAPQFCEDINGLKSQGVELSAFIQHSGHYTHSESMDVTFEITSAGNAEDPGSSERQEKKVNELQEQFHKFIKGVSCQFENDGYAIIEDNDSDESIDAMIDANGWLFTKDGHRSVTL